MDMDLSKIEVLIEQLQEAQKNGYKFVNWMKPNREVGNIDGINFTTNAIDQSPGGVLLILGEVVSPETDLENFEDGDTVVVLPE